MAGIFDIFGTSDQQAAANAQQQALQNALGVFSQNVGQGNQALQQQYGNANQALTGNIGQGIGALQQYFGQAAAPFQQLFGQGTQGLTQLGNALGLNGPQGNAAAVQGFQNNPGYGFQVQQATNAVDRNQAAAGMLGSGNTNVDLSNYISGLANTNWNQYLSQLQPFMGLAQNAAGGIGNIMSGLGSGINQAYGNLGQGLSGNFGALGQGLNQNFGALGNAGYATNVGIGNAQANADLAGLTASGNLLGALLGIGKMGVSGAGGSGGSGGGGTLGGNALSSLGSTIAGLFM